MYQRHEDMTMNEVLTDPLIRTLMRADGVTPGEFKTILNSAAQRLGRSETSRLPARASSAGLLDAPKRHLLALVRPRKDNACVACF